MKDDSGLQYHVKVKPGDVGRYVLLPGDPGRVEKMAKYLDDAQFVSSNREHMVFTGKLLGEKVSIVSTGMGCPSTAIAVEELIAVGADTFIRVGTSGAVQPWLKLGDVAVVTGAIRDEGTTRQYLPIEFPAIADIEVVNALAEACRRVDANYYLGVSQTKDSFLWRGGTGAHGRWRRIWKNAGRPGKPAGRSARRWKLRRSSSCPAFIASGPAE